ncbi:GNAT family N-acetyltransferase, partial [Gardnerella vaginalis]
MKLIRPDSKYIQGYIEANEEDEIFRPNAERRFRNYDTIIESS